jgi:structural maintenance of chromosome 3 (chondroitin sulfate proteoglycan 6)
MVASVEIIFDNTDRRMPRDQDEVSIRRAINAKKDEYFLDDKHVTKTEINNLMESAGLSRANPYYIVEQGEVNRLIRMSDPQRLDLLKEIAGTRAYDEKRKESLKIMKDTDKRRQTIKEVIDFYEQRLNELEDEKQELMEFQNLDSERRALEYVIYEEQLESETNELEQLDQQRFELTNQSGSAHADLAKLQEQRQAAVVKFNESSLHTTQLRSNLSQLLGDRTVAMQKRTQAELELTDLQERDATDSKQRVVAEKELAELEQQIAETQQNLEQALAAYRERAEEQQELESKFQTSNQRSSELYAKQGRAAQFNSKRDRDRFLNGKVQTLQADVKSDTKQLRAHNSKLADLKSHRAREDKRAEQLHKKETDFSSKIDKCNERLLELKQERNDATNARKQHWKQDDGLGKQFEQARNQYETARRSLQYTMDRTQWQGLEAVKKVVAEKKIRGVHGPLIELFSFDDSHFVSAIETAAGGRLFHIVVDDNKVAAKLVSILNQRKLGRATFIPLADIEAKNYSYPKRADCFPIISRLNFDDKFRPAMQQVFGKTLVARTLEVASQVARAHDFHTITLDGDQVNKRGALTGGFIDRKNSRLTAFADMRKAEAAYNELKAKSDEVKAETLLLEQRVTQSLGDIQRETMQKQNWRTKMQTVQYDLQAVVRSQQSIDTSIEEASEAVRTLEANIARTEAQLAALQTELGNDMVSELSAEEQHELAELTEETKQLQEQVMQASQARAEAESNKKQLENLLNANLLKRQSELREIVSSATPEDVAETIERISSSVTELKDTIADLEAQISKCETEATEQEQHMNEAQQDMESLKRQEADAEQLISIESKSIDSIMSRRNTCLRRVDELTRKIRELGSLPRGVNEYRNKRNLMSRLTKCNRKLKEFSHVNKKALEQFANFTRLRDDLLTRQTETERGRESIMELIEHLDQKKDDAIRRTFKEVALRFQQVFAELVPEGKASLVIHTDSAAAAAAAGDSDEKKSVSTSSDEDEDEDEDDDATRAKPRSGDIETKHYTGIGIKVNFTKAQRSTRELSGGQQTVVALALIFAIQRTDPSPFYMFDEIDFNLDAVHRTSVAKMVHKLSREIQFIITTFHPELLSTADQFVGVSFHDGARVSRIHDIQREEAIKMLQVIERQTEEQEVH